MDAGALFCNHRYTECMSITPVSRGRLFPEGSGKGKPVLQLLVFDSQDELQEWVEELIGELDGPMQWVDPLIAFTYMNGDTRKLQGTLAFCREGLDVGTIVHESFHAALGWGQWRRLDTNQQGLWASEAEEMVVCTAERLTTQILKRLKKWRLTK